MRNQGTGTLKSDCKQSLGIGIIRAINKCTGRLFRAATQHTYKSSDISMNVSQTLRTHCEHIENVHMGFCWS